MTSSDITFQITADRMDCADSAECTLCKATTQPTHWLIVHLDGGHERLRTDVKLPFCAGCIDEAVRRLFQRARDE